jgi:hypothetical protein
MLTNQIQQSLNQSGPRFAKYKPRVEEKFDTIKATTGEAKNGKNPVFAADQKAWCEMQLELLQPTRC